MLNSNWRHIIYYYHYNSTGGDLLLLGSHDKRLRADLLTLKHGHLDIYIQVLIISFLALFNELHQVHWNLSPGVCCLYC